MKSPTTFLVFKIYMLQMLYIQFLSLLLGIIKYMCLLTITLRKRSSRQRKVASSTLMARRGLKSHSGVKKKESRAAPIFFGL